MIVDRAALITAVLDKLATHCMRSDVVPLGMECTWRDESVTKQIALVSAHVVWIGA